jgi:hypothetical protein
LVQFYSRSGNGFEQAAKSKRGRYVNSI